jgi:ubiquinol-cytochrome c reductase cytochrome b subunit
LCSSNPLAYNHNNTITIFPCIIIKDILWYYVLCICFQFQLCLGIYSLCHPDNSIEVYELLTPQHIVPEWYFLCFYAILKTIPSKWLGFIIFLISIYILLLLCELWKLKSNWLRLMLVSFMWFNNSNLIITYSCIYFILELWIGALIPQDLIISSGRVLNFINNYNVYLHIYSWRLY